MCLPAVLGTKSGQASGHGIARNTKQSIRYAQDRIGLGGAIDFFCIETAPARFRQFFENTRLVKSYVAQNAA